jgi:uncharacterized protein YbjT (DUF2867 family)
MRKISVIITGATGNAGSGVLQAALNHSAVEKITVVTRKSTGKQDKKLVEIIHDNFLDYRNIKQELRDHHACYWCLGVTLSKVRGEEQYTRITYDYTIEAAKVLEKSNPGMTFCFLSVPNAGPDERSKMMVARVNGRTETDLGNFDFDLYNFRTGLIHPIKSHKNRHLIVSLLYPLIKNSKTRCVEADELGRAMINATLFRYEKHTLENSDIREFAKR